MHHKQNKIKNYKLLILFLTSSNAFSNSPLYTSLTRFSLHKSVFCSRFVLSVSRKLYRSSVLLMQSTVSITRNRSMFFCMSPSSSLLSVNSCSHFSSHIRSIDHCCEHQTRKNKRDKKHTYLIKIKENKRK